MIQLATHNHPNNGANGHRQQNVSPPPLKRRRTEFSTVSSHQNSPRPSPSALPVRLSYSSESFPSSEVRVTETLSDTMNQASEPHVRDSGDAVSTGTVLRVFQRLDRSLDDDERPSTSSSLTRSDRSSGSTSKRHLCGVCKMGSTTKFNPMVPCTSCRRRYHDGCRKPALDEGADDDTWKCWKCLERKQRPKHSLNLSHRPEQGSLVNANTTSRSPYIGENLHRAEYDVQGELNPLPTRISQPSPLSMEMSFSAATLSALLDSSINEKAGLIERTRMSREKLQSRPKHHGSEGVQLANTIDYDELDKMVDDSIKPSNRSMDLEQARGEKPTSRTMLCPTCQKQRVLINSGSEEPKCHNCRSQTTVAVTGERVIPETPDSAPQMLDRAAGHSPSPWFESNLVTPSRRITKKTATAQLVNLPVGLRRTQELRLESERVVSTHVSESIRDNEERVANDPTVNGSGISEDRDAIGEAAISKGIVEQSATSSAQVPSNQRAQQLSVKEAGKEDGRAPVNDSIMKPSQESAKEQPRARGEGIDLISLLFSDEPETTPGSTAPSLPVQAPVKLKPGYHLRAVIAMALLANDQPLLVSEIQECIAAASLPDYRRGEGRWEKNTSAILSQYNDFRGEKVPGQIKNRWSFADPITKAKYEKLYPEYEDLMGNGNRHLTQSPLLEETENTSESPIEPLHSNLHQSNPLEVVETHYDIPSSLATESESEVDSDSSITASDVEAEPLETDGIPFERSPSRRRQISLCLEQDVKRESSFHKIFPECKTKSIETMTRAEKTAKIAEIKSRPSRKAMFGSRLAHVRRHGLEDVHDERDGAWRPLATPRLQRVECGHDEMEMRDKGEEKSFRDIFDLPQNPIPMVYDDQLAFRDGTRVNGRLPRPRNVYKVGKRFGGEIRNLD